MWGGNIENQDTRDDDVGWVGLYMGEKREEEHGDLLGRMPFVLLIHITLPYAFSESPLFLCLSTRVWAWDVFVR